jgi:hypothetical protein
MKAICLTSFFTQDISGTIGQEIEITDQKVFDDLVKSGYIQPIENPTETEPKMPKRKATDKA